MIPDLSFYLSISGLLFAIGMAGIFIRRNLIGTLVGVELMILAGIINLAAFWRALPQPDQQQGIVFALFAIALAAAEAGVGLALILQFHKYARTPSIDSATSLRG